MLKVFSQTADRAGLEILHYLLPSYSTQRLPSERDLQRSVNHLRRRRLTRPTIDERCFRYYQSRNHKRAANVSRSPNRVTKPLLENVKRSPSSRKRGTSLDRLKNGSKPTVLPAVPTGPDTLADQAVSADAQGHVSVDDKQAAEFAPPSQKMVESPPIPSQDQPDSGIPPALLSVPSRDKTDVLSQEEARRAKVIRIRTEVPAKYFSARQEWQIWHEGYESLMAKHTAGQDPGFGDVWNAWWSREDFDLMHRKRATELLETLVKWQNTLDRALREGQRLGLPTLRWAQTGISVNPAPNAGKLVGDSKQNPDPSKDSSVTPFGSEDHRNRILRVCSHAPAQYLAIRERWQAWHENYASLRAVHTAGRNPGFEDKYGWQATWSLGELNKMHAKRAIELLKMTTNIHGTLDQALREGLELGLPTVKWPDERKSRAAAADETLPLRLPPSPATPAEMETRQRQYTNLRPKLLARYFAILKSQAWNDNYEQLRAQHKSGKDPGFSKGTWHASWSQEVFDEQYLKQAMDLTKVVVGWQKSLVKTLDNAKKLGLPPLDWSSTKPEVIAPPPQAPPKTEAARKPQLQGQSQSQDEINRVLSNRKVIVSSYKTAEANWTDWRASYPDLLATHLSGKNPGGFGESWDPRWSKEEFDVRHLHRAMELVQRMTLWWGRLEDVLTEAQKLGLPPLPWQIDRFAESLNPEEGFPGIEEEMAEAVRDAPHDTVNTWRNGLPAAAKEFQGEMADEAAFPDAYWPVEYPDDMDVDVEGEIYPWDVITSVADAPWQLLLGKSRIDGAVPLQESKRTEGKFEVKEKDERAEFRSHFW